MATRQSNPTFSRLTPTDLQGCISAISDIYDKLAATQQQVSGASGTFTLAKLTSGGSAGSVTVSHGLVTAFTAPS